MSEYEDMCISRHEACLQMDVTTRHIDNLKREGKIKVKGIGKKWMTSQEQIDTYLASKKVKGNNRFSKIIVEQKATQTEIYQDLFIRGKI